MKKVAVVLISVFGFFFLSTYGNQQGEQINYYESGTIASKANYVDWKLQGELLRYNLNGEIEKNEN